MNKKLFQSITPLLGVFIAVSGIVGLTKTWIIEKGVDPSVLLSGNFVLLLVSLAAFLLTNKALRSANPQAFVRAMYSSFIIKFFVLAITAFVYIMVAKKNVNKPGLIACAGLYIIYTGIETRALMKMLKQKKNA
jgi:hypothetical protein